MQLSDGEVRVTFVSSGGVYGVDEDAEVFALSGNAGAFAKRAEPSGVVAHDVGHGEGVEFDGVHGVAVGDDFA